MLIKDFKFKSATGVCTITANAFVPDDNNVRGVLVMHHGMAEHNERYHGFFEYLTSNGIAVFMHDMANHGKSNQNADETGYFGDKDGYKGLIKDMKSVYERRFRRCNLYRYGRNKSSGQNGRCSG